MRYILYVLSVVVLFSSCTRDSGTDPQPPVEPVLKKSIQRDAQDRLVGVKYYNEREQVTHDSLYANGSLDAGMINVYTYNSKGKMTRREYYLPILYTGGTYWDYHYSFQADTIPTVSYRYFKGGQVAHITHFRNTSNQVIMDSTYHTPNYGTYTYLTKYMYDVLGRVTSSTDLNHTRDTTKYTTYQYGPNSMETRVKSFAYNPDWVSYGLTITSYTSGGRISSEKKYGGEVPQLFSSTDYTYHATGRLQNRTTIFADGTPSEEERYFNDAVTGKPEKMEFYRGGQLAYVTTYYYE